jgi:hypothetical protein
MKIISKDKAKELGELYYFTGQPCKHGHIAVRKVCNSACYECHRERQKKYWKANPGKYLKKSREWAEKNRDKNNAYKAKYRKNNPEKIYALTRLKQAEKLQRTPAWLTGDDIWMMREIYELAALRTKLTGVKWEVDHIIPLRGKLVSGLHVPSNLQVITQAENRRKHRTWDPDNGE